MAAIVNPKHIPTDKEIKHANTKYFHRLEETGKRQRFSSSHFRRNAYDICSEWIRSVVSVFNRSKGAWKVYMKVSLRTPLTQARYEADKADGMVKDLADEPSLHEFKYWRIIRNRYPHDKLSEYIVTEQHALLLPIRQVAYLSDLTINEQYELNNLLDFGLVKLGYDTYPKNGPSMQSIQDHLHFHLYVWKEAHNG